MSIVLFKEITTDEALSKMEAEGKKYEGLYVDMNDKEQRKYVKDNAQLITGLLKRLDRARIDMSKAYKAQVEAEANSIRERLEAANLPFSKLIDAHKEERAAILAEQKAEEEAAALLIQIEQDHESALLMDKVQTIEKAEREQARIEYEERIADEAAERAVEQERKRQEAAQERALQEQLQRENNAKHVSSVRRAAKESLMALGLSEDSAKSVVMAINNGYVANVTINY